MNVPIYNLEKKQMEEVSVPDVLFSSPWKPALVKQAIVTQQANSRQKTAAVKNRGEVRGGGKKPWKQKGTGRARHGSIRSPLWTGGGVTHGPTDEKTYGRKINKKMKAAALFSLMSKKYNDGKVLVIDGITKENTAKTRDFYEKTKLVGDGFKNFAVITASTDKNIYLASRNAKRGSCISATSLNIADIAKPEGILIAKQALPEIIGHFITKAKKETAEKERPEK